MERAVCFASPRVVTLEDSPPLAAGPGQVRLRTLYSGISAGTELTAYLGSNPYLTRSWDTGRRLFVEGAATFPYPVTGWGYEEVGVVTGDSAEAGLHAGDVVWGIWGHRSDGLLPAAQAARQVLPPGTDPVAGVFARPGAIALNALLDADAHPGETVAVFGQGVIGLLATRLLALSGVRVIAVDTQPARLAISESSGAWQTVTAGPDAGVAEQVKQLTHNHGADVCIELSGSYAALHEAIRAVCYGGRVVAAGFYQGSGSDLRLGEEFHHNRVEIVASQISGPPFRHRSRWTRERLHEEFMRLVTEGQVDPRPLVSHVLPAAAVAGAFTAITDPAAGALQVVLDFRSEQS
ncbi:MAG TPA: zinc-binding alcohol dehydrogenase [Streptosporangiaceae bacterium]|nr:zinc-binding alcohol dehydrogenase [Streptosporangiaceae bacterium]